MNAIDRDDTAQKIAEVLDLSKPVSDCPECGGLGEIRSLGSRRKCECLYIRLKTLKRELDMRHEVISELSKERNMYKASSEVFYERLKKAAEQREKLVECLRFYERLARGREINDGGRRARTILAEIGVTA